LSSVSAERRISFPSFLTLPCLLVIAAAVPMYGQRTGARPPEPALPSASAPAPPPNQAKFDRDQLILDSQMSQASKKIQEDTCFLPPLGGVHSVTVGVKALQVPAKARKDYEDACAALKDKEWKPRNTCAKRSNSIPTTPRPGLHWDKRSKRNGKPERLMTRVPIP